MHRYDITSRYQRSALKLLTDKIESLEDVPGEQWNKYPCLIWHKLMPNGYGYVTVDHVNKWTHRVAWEIMNGQIQDSMVVCHHCDVKSCYRPSHLFAGSQADNISDKVRKNRQARGSLNGMAKLTEEQVLEIRRLYRPGATTLAEVGAMFGFDKTLVYKIISRKTWRHI